MVVTLPAVNPAAVPVMLVPTKADGVPKFGVTSVGEVAKTKLPLPVSLVTAAARLADDGVVKKVATPLPKPEMPVATGKPVALVKVPDEGVPNAPPLMTGAPAVPTLTANAVATPVPRPLMPVETGKPVALVRVTLVGVPRSGVTKVGEVARTLSPVPVLVTLTTCLLALSAKAVEAVRPDKVDVPLTERSVKLPAAPPSTRCQVVPLNVAQSPTPQLPIPSKVVVPATDTM